MGAKRRILSLWLGIWFVFVVAEPVPIHECVMHNPLVAMQRIGDHKAVHQHDSSHPEAPLVAGDEDCNEDAPPSSGHQETSQGKHRHHPTSHTTSSGAHLCLCLGCASGSAPVTGAQAQAPVPVPETIARVQATYALIERSAPEPEFILPPSTAPPVLS